MSDRTLMCRDCGQEFVFTQGEQDFYTQRGFSEPQRCPTCRQARKAQRNTGAGDGGYAGGGYSSGGYSSSSSSSGGGYGNSSYGNSSYGNSSGYDSAPRQLYPATCSECGKQTEVPFNPSPGKPVYCRECFASRRSTPRYNSY